MKIIKSYKIDSKIVKAVEKEAKQKKVTNTAVVEKALRNYFHIFNEY